MAHRLREAHLHHGIPWSRMAVIVRSLQHQHAAAAPGADPGRGADRPPPPRTPPLATQPAVAPAAAAAALRAGRVRQLDEEAAVGAAALAAGRGRPARPSAGCARACGRSRSPAGDRRPSGELLVEALRDPAELAAVDRRWAGPAPADRRRCSPPPGRPRPRRRPPPRTCCGRCGGPAAWPSGGRPAERPGRPRAGATADRDLDAVLVLFDAAARFTDRLPGARIEAFLDHLLDQQLPADTLAPTRRPGRGGAHAHRARGQGPGVGRGRGRRRAGGRLAGPAAARQRARLGAAGRRRGRPGATRPGTAVAARSAALLDEERRLFYVAATRARRCLLVTAVDPSSDRQRRRGAAQPVPGRAGRDGRPRDRTSSSRADADRARAGVRPGELPRPLTLPALVAELRAAVADPATPERRRRAAAAELARLAAAGVPGADPDEWWGLRAALRRAAAGRRRASRSG